MYNAISDQLLELGLIKSHQASNPVFARRTAANYLRANRDDFIAFLPSVNGEDTKDATEHDGVMTPAEFNQYCRNVEETGEWGGEPEIQALSRAFDVPIHVFQAGPPTVVSHGGAGDAAAGASTAEQSAAVGDRVVRITYHRRMYGLGEVSRAGKGEEGRQLIRGSTTTRCGKTVPESRAVITIPSCASVVLTSTHASRSIV